MVKAAVVMSFAMVANMCKRDFVLTKATLRFMTTTAHPTTLFAPSADATAASVEDLSNVSIEAPLIGSHNSYLADQSTAIRARNIPWEGYQKVGKKARYFG